MKFSLHFIISFHLFLSGYLHYKLIDDSILIAISAGAAGVIFITVAITITVIVLKRKHPNQSPTLKSKKTHNNSSFDTHIVHQIRSNPEIARQHGIDTQ